MPPIRRALFPPAADADSVDLTGDPFCDWAADALGVSPGTAMCHASLGGAGWSAYAARRHPHTPGDQTSQ